MEARSFARADGPYGFLQPLRPGRWPQASTILLHAAPQVGRRAHLLVTFPEPQDEQGLREVVRHWGGVHLRGGDESFDGEALGSLMGLFRQFRILHSPKFGT